MRTVSPAAVVSAMLLLVSAKAGLGAPDNGHCPSSCECSVATVPAVERGEVVVVNCSGRGLRQFPQDAPNDTQVLLLSHNSLRNLSSLPALPSLLHLDLSHNDIAFLDNHWVFEHMGLLLDLDLSHNALHTLQHGSFSGLQSLQVLRLNHNNIRDVQLHAFGGLNHLNVLHLGSNDLYQLRRAWLLGMSSLRELYVENNHIAVIEERTFDKHGSLLHLDISDNGLRRVADEGFVGLTQVKVLNMSDNYLEGIPTVELQHLVNLEILLMDGIPVTRLYHGDFRDFGVSSLSLSFLPKLQVVHSGAFTNLTRLRTLQLHDNPNLIFIHPRAFQGVPLLHRVLVHNNQLVTLSEGIKNSLPMLDELHLYHNPLHCDCNLRWLKRDLLAFYPANHTHNHSGYIQEAGMLSCNTPALNTSMQLLQVPPQFLPPVCAPTTLPLFPDKINISLGDEVTLECQAVGVPEPTLTWILPDGRQVNCTTDSESNSFPREPVAVPVQSTADSVSDTWDRNNTVDNDSDIARDNTVLTIHGVQPGDQGSYACVASNAVGQDASSTALYVHNKELHLAVTDVANNYITVAWVGAIQITQIKNFQIYYRPSGSSQDYDKVYLHSSIHKCRLAGLTPMTSYEICIVYRERYTVECGNFSTDHRVVVFDSGITRVNVAGIVASACSVVGVLLALCFGRAVLRRLRKRKDYKDPLRDGGDADKIPLEPLHHHPPPGTPLCSSRTALLPHSQI